MLNHLHLRKSLPTKTENHQRGNAAEDLPGGQQGAANRKHSTQHSHRRVHLCMFLQQPLPTLTASGVLEGRSAGRIGYWSRYLLENGGTAGHVSLEKGQVTSWGRADIK